MAHQEDGSAQSPDDYNLEGLNRRFLGDRVEVELNKNPNIRVVGQLTLLQPGTHRGYTSVRDFYVEPTDSPAVEAIEDREVVDLMHAAARKTIFLRPSTFKVPEQFAATYNQILETMLRPENFADGLGGITLFTPTVSFRAAKVSFGSLTLREPYPVGKTVMVTQSEFDTPELQRQAVLIGAEASRLEYDIPGIIRVRLFPTGLGRRVAEYERGYYLEGNVEEWKELVWRGKYISIDAVSPEQLVAISEGLEPYPEVVRLPYSTFYEGTPEEVKAIRKERLHQRSSRDSWSTFARFADNLLRTPTS